MLNLQCEARQKKERQRPIISRSLLPIANFEAVCFKKNLLSHAEVIGIFFSAGGKDLKFGRWADGRERGRPLVVRKRIKEVDIAQELLHGACLSSLLFLSQN